MAAGRRIAVEANALATLGAAEAERGDEAAALTAFEDAARLTEVEGETEATSRLRSTEPMRSLASGPRGRGLVAAEASAAARGWGSGPAIEM